MKEKRSAIIALIIMILAGAAIFTVEVLRPQTVVKWGAIAIEFASLVAVIVLLFVVALVRRKRYVKMGEAFKNKDYGKVLELQNCLGFVGKSNLLAQQWGYLMVAISHLELGNEQMFWTTVDMVTLPDLLNRKFFWKAIAHVGNELEFERAKSVLQNSAVEKDKQHFVHLLDVLLQYWQNGTAPDSSDAEDIRNQYSNILLKLYGLEN